jgi:hypothetical protein
MKNERVSGLLLTFSGKPQQISEETRKDFRAAASSTIAVFIVNVKRKVALHQKK